MRSLHGFSLRRRPLLLLVTSLVFSGVLGSSSRPALCDVSCCAVQPSCDNARVVTCNCPNMETMTLRKGAIPGTVRAVNILNTKRLTIDKDAINGLQYLTNFTLSDIDELEFKQDGMASHDGTELRSVTFQKIGTLRVESKAFSGVWQPKTSIRMHQISDLDIKANAFDYQVTELGPSISLQHVEMLNLEPKGFSADVFELNLFNVTLDVCHGESFGGNILNNELNNVTISEATAKCFFSLNDFTTFNLQSVKIKNAQPQAFSGNMRELIIKNSHFSTIHEHSFNISVTSMELTNSYIGELRSNGLTVNASDTLRIDTVRVEYLRKHALVGLQMKQNKDEFPQPVVIRKLELIETENGSLTFSECTKVRLTDVDLMAPWPRICPTEKWTQALSGGGVSGQLTPAQYQLFFQLFQRRLCYEDGWRQFPISVESPRCSTRTGRGVSNQPDSVDDDGEGNAPPSDTFDVPAPVETRASPALPAPPVSSAPDHVYPMVGDAVDAVDRYLNLPSSADGSGRAGGAGGARGSSRAGAASSPSEAVPADDRHEGGNDGGLDSSKSPFGFFVIDISETVELSIPKGKARTVDTSHEVIEEDASSDESEEESAASLDSQGPYAAESGEQVDNGGLHGSDNSDKDMQRIPEDFWRVKKVLASEPPNKTRDTLVGALRYRGDPEFALVSDVPVSISPDLLPPTRTRISSPVSPASPAFGAFQKLHQNQLLCMAVGAVLTLAVVLAVLLLLMLTIKRRHNKVQPISASGSFYSLQTHSVDCNRYEAVKEDHHFSLQSETGEPGLRRPFLEGLSCGKRQW